MTMILAGAVEPVQLGAFLCLLRIKTETPEELAGMTEAARAHIRSEPLPKADIDWASWAGKSRQLPLYLLSALALAASGVRIFMHGAEHHTAGRVYTSQSLVALGLMPASDRADAGRRLDRSGFAYMTLDRLSPALQSIMDLKALLGLRSPLHTVGRLLNPSGAPVTLAGVTHPAYLPLHQQAAALLGQPFMAAFKGEGGLAERRPEKSCEVHFIQNGVPGIEEWPALMLGARPHEEHLDLTLLPSIWSGAVQTGVADATIIGTIALALKYSGRAESVESAQGKAAEIWRNRPGDLRCFA